MKVLITGAAGDVGGHLVRFLAARGMTIRALDRIPAEFSQELVQDGDKFTGSVADRELVDRAVAGTDAVIHLAWSFSNEVPELFREDLPGMVNLLEAAVKHRVRRFIYTSTATVYGRAVTNPVKEEHPCLVFQARKPLYALTKRQTEELCAYYFQAKGLPVTVFRFWWAFGETIGGRHLRNLIRAALKGETLEVPAGAGGTFVTMDDLANACLLTLKNDQAAGQVYNLGSFYITWEQIAGMILKATGGTGGVKAIPLEEWQGPQFLSDSWEISWEKATRELGYRPGQTPEEGARALGRTIGTLARRLASGASQ